MAFSDYSFSVERPIPPRPVDGSPCEECAKPNGTIYRKQPGYGKRSTLGVTCRECWLSNKTQNPYKLGCPRPVSAFAKQVAGWVARVDLSHFPLPLRMHVDEDPLRGVSVSVEMFVPDRNDLTTHLAAGDAYVVAPHTTERQFFDMLRTKVRDTVLHEIDEQFRVDGKIMFDPHEVRMGGFMDFFFGPALSAEAARGLDRLNDTLKAEVGKKVVVKTYKASTKRKGPPKGAKENKKSWEEAQRRHATRFARGPVSRKTKKR